MHDGARSTHPPLDWPSAGNSRVPYRVFADEQVHTTEAEQIFMGATWQLLCLANEVPSVGDYKTTFVGETPVVVIRGEHGEIHAFENRCVHKGALVCLKNRGNARSLTCVYHNWIYDLRGQLQSAAFQKGVKGRGGMPDDFDVKEHRLRPLRTEALCGLVFGTFSDDTPGLEDFIGEEILQRLRRVLNRPLKILGHHTQHLNNNWKLYVENVKDTYHAGLLHLFFATFRLNRLASEGGVVIDETGGNHTSYSKRRTIHANAEYDNSTLRASRDDYRLSDPSLLDSFDEFGDGINVQILSVFPSFILQQVENSIAVRQILPKGVGKTELNWTVLGFADDDERTTKMRLKQANLIGPAGYISMEDGAVGAFVQRGIPGALDETSIVEMGGREHVSQNTRTTEASVRGFWAAYRAHMDL
ncbi:MAG: Rieske 2Fe-2S domain-containing protein [Chromatiales bacterium]|jgi:phenylpropionate dioxygenase-like ring-hydroxylating dioxygenase large terminal subunit|nr:Rieske 2Fe-2S domain-containing protein [Chromatiales bacterium]